MSPDQLLDPFLSPDCSLMQDSDHSKSLVNLDECVFKKCCKKYKKKGKKHCKKCPNR